MSEIRKNAWVFLLWSTLAGTISFFVSAVITSMVLSPLDFAIIDTILAGGIGGLFLGIFLIKRHKIQIMALSGLAAIPVGFWGAFILAGGVDLLFSLIGVNTVNPNIYNIENIIGIIFMGIICGAIFGAIIYGRKSIWVFSAVCGMVSFPFGILVGFLNSEHPIKATFENLLAFFGSIDLNFLAIITSFGIGTGLSIGLFSMLKQKSTD
ncbi:MAG TPA: hypothetical protein PLW11_05095 [Bacillota bacterium]|nr:hypothetical protein [Bacillota bacterium]